MTLTQTPAAGLPTRPAAATPYVIALPAGLPLLNSNQRMHHHDRRRITAQLRAAAMEAVSENPALMDALAAAKPGPLFERAHILGILHPPKDDRRDPANWYPSFKAVVDGIVDAGVLEDDDHTRAVGPDMRLGRKVPRGQIVLVVRALAEGLDWPESSAVAA